METEVSPKETLFAGIIRLTEKNVDFVLDCFDDFPIAFGLISPRRKSAFKTNRKDFLETLIAKGLKHGEFFWKNWLKIAVMLIRPGRKFFTLQHLNDTEHFSVFYHKEDAQWEHQLKTFISRELQTKPILQN